MPANFLHKVGKFFGFKDIKIISQPEFSDRFILRGDDEEGIRSFFTNDIVDSLKNKQDLCLESKNNILLLYRNSKLCKSSEIAGFLE